MTQRINYRYESPLLFSETGALLDVNEPLTLENVSSMLSFNKFAENFGRKIKNSVKFVNEVCSENDWPMFVDTTTKRTKNTTTTTATITTEEKKKKKRTKKQAITPQLVMAAIFSSGDYNDDDV